MSMPFGKEVGLGPGDIVLDMCFTVNGFEAACVLRMIAGRYIRVRQAAMTNSNSVHEYRVVVTSGTYILLCSTMPKVG